jgi:hypothetical protein
MPVRAVQGIIIRWRPSSAGPELDWFGPVSHQLSADFSPALDQPNTPGVTSQPASQGLLSAKGWLALRSPNQTSKKVPIFYASIPKLLSWQKTKKKPLERQGTDESAMPLHFHCVILDRYLGMGVILCLLLLLTEVNRRRS